jgi:pilus assembly protein FimV
MPSHNKFPRAPLWCALSLALGLTVVSPQADAAGLGRLNVTSGLGQPLRAELEVTSVGRDELPTLQVRMAPLAAFRAANLDFNPALTNLRFALDKRPDGGYFVRISSASPVNEPYLDLMVELTWATGRVIREYTVLLDPPSLRADAPVVPPVAAASTPTAPSVTPPATRPSTAPSSTPSSPGLATTPPGTPAASARAPSTAATSPAATTPRSTTPSEGSYVVKSGDTLGAIAARNKPASVSLDQMLVAMLRANPDAFVAKNMNRLKAGATLTIPSESDAAGLAQPDARREVVAQSADFTQYKSRLAQAVGSAPVVATAPPAAAGSGRVTSQVQDKSAPVAPKGDQLKIARAEQKAQAATAAAAKADEAAAKARAIREEQERAAQLKKTNEAIQKALQVQSKAGAAAQNQAEKGAPVTATPPTAVAPPPVAVAPPAPMPAPTPPSATPGVTTPAPSPVAPVTPPGVPPTTPTPIDTSKAGPVAAVTSPATTPPAAVTPPPAVTPAPAPVKKSAPPPAPPREEPGFFSDLLSNTTTLLGLVGIVALLAALFGWSWYRKRRAESADRFKDTGEGSQANSLFGATGGQSVDTGTSTFNSSFIPAASQLDSNEVDPVAEADVYIAYGREEQAEDILKEALRLQPDRHAVRVKLMEIYARRGDKTSFMAVAEELRDRTGATGEDWERGVKLGRTVDPAHAMFAGAALSEAARGPTTGFRLDPNTNTRSRPSTLGGGATGGLDLGGLTGAGSSVMSRDTNVNVPPLTQMVVDTRMGDSKMQVETKMPADTKLSGPNTTSAPTTQFKATLPGAQPAQKNGAAGAPMTGAATDFGSLDFDLGPTRMGNLEVATRMPDLDGPSRAESEVFAATTPQRAEPPAVSDMDFALPKEKYQPMAPTATGVGAIPDLDLNIPPPTRMPVAPSTRMPVAPAAAMEEALSRPTVIGVKQASAVASLPDEQAARLTANTDQATVPLIDFDLSAVSLDAATKRGETEPGSALAQQMATKLDLARGYIDLGVKDGARELLDEVMRDGTREQRQAAVDLIKQIES